MLSFGLLGGFEVIIRFNLFFSILLIKGIDVIVINLSCIVLYWWWNCDRMKGSLDVVLFFMELSLSKFEGLVLVSLVIVFFCNWRILLVYFSNLSFVEVIVSWLFLWRNKLIFSLFFNFLIWVVMFDGMWCSVLVVWLMLLCLIMVFNMSKFEMFIGFYFLYLVNSFFFSIYY